LGHAFGGFAGASALSPGHVDRAAHKAHPTEDGDAAEFDLGDEDARMDGGVEQDVERGEVVGDDGAAAWDGAADGEGDVESAQDTGAEAAEPGGALGACARAGDGELDGGVGEVGDDE